ncbi:muscle M-line assembly protein unc-89-like protein [Carex littledalei]|uniref:Muscle M-line assembly protein unc-89-like protein n=1 Tax=Carex littledalei TaxID=544730 RepID=A0A833QTT8_9POAL|nr:muscle M-line assembly protein unc-89-like protein [Carex littledalei]
MGKKRKVGESGEREELEQLRSEEDKPDKKKQKRKRERQLDSSQEKPKHHRDPHRVFLESLYQQLPDNELARQWMIEWGLLPHEEAIKVLENVLNERDVPPDGVGKAKAKLKKKKVRL